MKVINFSQAKRERHEDRAEDMARSMILDLQDNLMKTFILSDGSAVGLMTAQRLLCRYWKFADECDPKASNCRSKRYEVAILEEEERAISHELFLARRDLALLECPFSELDIIEHNSGLKGWVAAIDWSREGYLVQIGRFGKLGQPVRSENRIFLWGPADIAGWQRVGVASEAKARKAGWMDRS